MSPLRGSSHGPRGFPQFLDTTEQRRALTGTLTQSVKRPRRTEKKRAKFRVTFARSLSSLHFGSRHSSIRGRVVARHVDRPVIDRARKSATSHDSPSHLRFADSPTITANFWMRRLGHAGTHRHALPLSSRDEIWRIATFISSSSTTSKRCYAPRSVFAVGEHFCRTDTRDFGKSIPKSRLILNRHALANFRRLIS